MMRPVYKEALIKGAFTQEKAKEILNTLFRSKIKMHSLTAFSSLIKTGSESPEDNSRKKELTESLEKLITSIDEIADPDTVIKLNCEVKMHFIPGVRIRKRHV